MVLGPRIVFLIDRYQGEKHNLKQIIANINLCCLRILCYYKHSSCTRGVKSSSILWGYKFFNSVGKQTSHRYKQGHFLEYATGNFDKFENELYDGICVDETFRPEKDAIPGEKLKVALTELITEFQWDRPELFSPGKVWKPGNNYGELNNQIFLFSNCPSGYETRTYFDECYQDHNSFIECMFSNVLYNKFVKHLKIKLCWIDTCTGDCISNKTVNDDTDHKIVSDGLRSINGCFLEMKYLASWWVYSGKNLNFKDVVNVSSLVKCIIDNSHEDEDFYISKYSFSFNDIYDCILSICSMQPELVRTKECNEEINSINVKELVDFKSMNMSTMNFRSSYFFAINPKLSKSNSNLLIHLDKICFSGQSIRIQFIPPCSSEICDALMILYTSFFGTIIPYSSVVSDVQLSKESETVNCEKNVLDDITEEMKLQFNKSLNLTKQDIGTSLVNSIDTWFLANPKLGCPSVIRNMLCNLCGDKIAMQKKRDGNSKVLVEHMKDTNSYLKSNTQERTNVKNLLHGLSCGKLRLKGHRKKQRDKDINKNENGRDNQNENLDHAIVEPNDELPSKDKLIELVSSDYEMLLQRSLSLSIIRNIFLVVIQFYKSSEPDSYKESSFSLLNTAIFNNVEDIRDKNVDTPKEDLIKEYLIQVHLYLECIHHFSPPNTEPVLGKIVSFLRTVSFEKSTAFVCKHLNEIVLPRYPDMTDFLKEIYENLMLDFPEELEDSRDMDVDDDASVKSVSSLKSYCSTEYSPSSIQAEKRTIRRKSSVVGDSNANKKVIAVQVKKTNKEKVKKKKAVSEEKVVKRTLFTEEPPTSNVLATPKPIRRYSVPAAKQKVPDTPETRQINDMMWKKLERKRRYSNIDKKMITIEESPLKEIASPIKRHSSFYRSSSFNCHTSPRRFYKIQRHPSMIIGSHGVSQGTFQDKLSNLPHLDKPVSASPLEVKLRRRSTLFSNFDDDGVDENQVVPIKTDDDEDSDDIRPVLRKEMLENTPVKQRSESHISKRLKLSPGIGVTELNENEVPRIKKLARFNSELNTVIENSDNDQPVFMTETTVDWLTEIEKEQSNTPTNFHDAFAKLSNTPVTIQSPAVIKAGNESIQVSPCLSASSIEVLEKAPLISPIITKRKRKRGRLLHEEYD